MEALALAQVFVRRWRLLVLLSAIGVGIALTWSAATPRWYESVVTLQLNPAARSVLLPYSAGALARLAASYDEAMRRWSLASGLPVAPQAVAAAITTRQMTSLAASYGEVLRSRSFGEVVVRELSLPVAPEAVAAAITTRLIPHTNILRLTVTWDRADGAQQLAQAIAEIFVTENLR